MTNVLIHRCVLRIRRTEGWAWGADPSALLASATRALPRLIGSRLPEVAARVTHDVHVTVPVRVKVVTTVRELVALGTESSPAAGALQSRIASAVADAIARATPTTSARDVAAATDAAARDPEELPATELSLDDAAAPWLALRIWSRSGSISDVLARMDDVAIAHLEALLFPPLVVSDSIEHAATVAGAATHRSLVELARTVAQQIALAVDTPAGAARMRIALAAALMEAAPSTSPAAIHAAITEIVARGAKPSTIVEPSVPAVARRRASGMLEVRSVLPFLLLPSLHHAGWLATSRTLLAAHDAEGDAFALAAGIAARVLDPLDRGWSRSRADRIAMAAFAGRDEDITDREIAAASLRIAPLLPALDASLRAVLMRARRPLPLVLTRDQLGWQLLDCDGMVVLASSAELAAVLASAPDTLILVAAAHAEPATLDRIDLANRRFITDAPAGRREAWRSFAGVHGRLVTNDTATSSAQLTAQTSELASTFALADELIEQLAVRPALSRRGDDRFEASCALAATAPLADLGARLFPSDATTPVLVLTRFRDLDARVYFDDDCIRVRVPIGRRHGDLMRHGVLGSITNVPWLDGRSIDLGGG